MKAAVVYWSGTGNTAAMADLVLEGMRSAGAQAELIECGAVADLSEYEAIAFGCPLRPQWTSCSKEGHFYPRSSPRCICPQWA